MHVQDWIKREEWEDQSGTAILDLHESALPGEDLGLGDTLLL